MTKPNDVDRAPVHVVVTSQLLDEYVRNCEKNIRQHPERNEHFIEAPTRVLIAIIEELRSMKGRVRKIDRACLDTIQVGGYYVVYTGGYKSWSPAEAFEDGYTKV